MCYLCSCFIVLWNLEPDQVRVYDIYRFKILVYIDVLVFVNIIFIKTNIKCFFSLPLGNYVTTNVLVDSAILTDWPASCVTQTIRNAGDCSFVRRFICPKVHLSEGSSVRRFTCPKVHLSEGSFVRRFLVRRSQINSKMKFQWTKK